MPRAIALLAVLLLAAPGPARAQDCLEAAARAEREQGLPAGVLAAIAVVESGRPDPRTGETVPWAWSIDADGQDAVFPDAASAALAAAAWQARGVVSLDVGCMQINLLHHPLAFVSLAEAFEPAANARYAARFLAALFAEFGDWPRAIAAYHSRSPAPGELYAARVLAAWGTRPRGAAPSVRASAAPWTAPWAGPAVPPPTPRPWMPGAAPGEPLALPVSAVAEQLMDATASCAVPPPAGGWGLARRCGSSPFASADALRRLLRGQ